METINKEVIMESSILFSIKKLLGLNEEYEAFDTDIIIHINSVFGVLTQLGVGPKEGFSIEDSSATWEEYVQGKSEINFVKTYIYLKVRLLFDPPQNSALTKAIEDSIKEYEWRLNIAVDPEIKKN